MSTADARVPGEMSLLEHLEELRSRLFKVSAAVVLGTVVGYVVFPWLFDLLISPYCSVFQDIPRDECGVIATEPLEPFSVRIKVAMLVGLFLGGPVVFWQLWRFIVPGLTERERRYAAPFVFTSQLLFACGIAFAWFILPNALAVLVSLGGPDIEPLLTSRAYVSFVLTTSVAFGIVFLLPVVLTFLSLVGVLSSTTMRTARPYAVVAIAVVAAMVTPTTDPVTMLLMMAPMVIFYEISVLLARLFERRRARRAATG